MKALKHKLSLLVASVLLCLAVLVPNTFAAEGIPQAVAPSCTSVDGGETVDGERVDSSDEESVEKACEESTDCKPADGQKLNEENCGIIQLIVGITNALSAIAGVVIVGVIIWGGVQYSAAGADATKVQAAKSKITNALIALLLLIFGYSLLQWLIPGGVLNGFGFIY